MTPTCPKCKRPLPNEDINVATDIAFCRPCNTAHQFSTLVHGVPLDTNIDFTRPPNGAWYSSGSVETVVGATQRSIGTAIGALLFGLFWNGILSVFIFVAVSATLSHFDFEAPAWFPKPEMNGGPMGVGMTIFLWLFLTPFICVGLAMIFAFLSAAAGKTEVRINALEGVLFSGVGPLGFRRRFRPDQVKDVRVEETRRGDDESGKSNILIELHDRKKPIKFGSTLRDDRKTFVAAAVRKALLGK